MKLWRSGIIWTVLSFVGGLGNYAFSIIIGHKLKSEYGTINAALTFTTMLGLPMQIVTMALIHYIAHFRGKNDQARLQGLLAGCRDFLVKVTIAGSVLAIVASGPLGRFFGFARPSLMLATLICVLVGLWSGIAVAICQGMAWFKRLAVIGLIAVIMRLTYGIVLIYAYDPFPNHHAEVAVSATTFSLLGNLILLYWWRTIFHKEKERISPWNRELGTFLVFTAAVVVGNYFFMSGDSLVGNRYFTKADLTLYTAAALLGRAVPQTVGPLLMVMFTSRSSSKEAHAVTDQRILLALYAAGLACGAAGVILLRRLFVRIIFGAYNEQSAEMVIPLSITMAFIGLNQAIGMWSLANRWLKTAILYGGLGFAYWLALLEFGRTPSALLHAMLLGAASGFIVLCAGWWWRGRNQPSTPALAQ